MSFFQGATNVKINGGEFTVVNGDYTVFDQSRHTSNIDSFNTTNNTMIGSFNNNSQHYHNRCGKPRLSQQQMSQINHASSPEASIPYVPNPHPSTAQPPIANAYAVPLRSTVNHRNYMNRENNNIYNSFEDNSQTSNAPLPPDYKDVGNKSVTGSGSMKMASTLRTQYAGAGGISTATASVLEGNMFRMPLSMRRTVKDLMKQVVKDTAPEDSQQNRADEDEDGDDSDSTDSDQEEEKTTPPGRHPTNTVNTQHGLAQLSFEDASTRPAYSRNKSAAQDPAYEHTPKSMSNVVNDGVDRPDSAPPPQQGNPHGYILPQAPPPYQSGYSNSQMINAFGSAAVISPNNGGPSYTTVNGPYTKYDYSHRISNMNSGNTHNTQFQDSFNDESTHIVAPVEREFKPQRQGKNKIRRNL